MRNLMDRPTQLARAAWAYSGLEQRELASEAGVEIRTLNSYLGLSRPGPSLEVLYRIADACGVPRSFMESGFDSLADSSASELEEALMFMNRTVADLGERLAIVESSLGGLLARSQSVPAVQGGRRATPPHGELARRAENYDSSIANRQWE